MRHRKRCRLCWRLVTLEEWESTCDRCNALAAYTQSIPLLWRLSDWALGQMDLKPREETVLRLLCGLGPDAQKPMTLYEIGDQFGVSAQRVRQILGKAWRTIEEAEP